MDLASYVFYSSGLVFLDNKKIIEESFYLFRCDIGSFCFAKVLLYYSTAVFVGIECGLSDISLFLI